MKKALIIITLLLAAGTAARAEVYLGARYGAGLSMMFFSPYQNERSVFTPVNAAVAFRYCHEAAQDYERRMNFMWELGYAERGYAIGSYTSGDSSVMRYKSQVLEMPLIMQARVPVVKHVYALITGMVYGAYYLNNERTYSDAEVTLPAETFAYTHLNGFEYGVGGGLGLCLSFGNTDFALDARYMAGMSYLIKPTIDLYESMPMQVVFSFSVMQKIGK